MFAATSCSGSSRASAPLPRSPAVDPFYRAPSHLAALGHGQLIRSRSVSISAYGASTLATVQTLLFTSTDPQGRPIAASGTVFTPHGTWTGRGARPIIAVQPPYDSVGAQCIPSYVMRFAGEQPNLDVNVVANLVREGREVLVPDYEGPRSLFGVGPQAGRIVVDGVTAVESSGLGGSGPDSPVGLWGYSGGGLATAWAAELQPGYAPSLRLVGAAEGGVPTDLKATLEHLNGGPDAGLGALALIGISRAYPAAGVLQALNGDGRARFASLGSACATSGLVRGLAGLRLDSLAAAPGLLERASLQGVFSRLRLGHHAPTSPVYDYYAIHDDVVEYTPDRRVLDFYCSNGTVVDAVGYPQGDHLAVAAAGTPAAFAWLADRLAGKPAPDTC